MSTSTDATTPAVPVSGVGRRRRTRRPTPEGERRLVWLAALGAALAAALVLDGAPTADGWLDVVWRATLGGGVALLASRARRWAWLVSGGAAGLLASSLLWALCALVAVGVAFVAVVTHRHRVLGAVVGGLVVLVVGSFSTDATTGVPTVLAVLVLSPLVVSGYANVPSEHRRRLNRALVVGAVAVVLATGVAAAGAARALGPARAGAAQVQDGLEAFGDGDAAAASRHLDDAQGSFGTASTALGGPWMLPTRLVPVLAQQVDAAATATREGQSVARVSARSSAQADPEQLRYVSGRIDLDAVASAAALLEETSEAIIAAEAAVLDAESVWLVPPLRDELGRFGARLSEVAPQSELAAEAAGQAPSLLGADGDRRYLVLFTTPAEMRGAGGFVGNWAVLSASDGALELSESGRAVDVNATPGRETRRVSAPEDYVRRWGDRFEVGQYFQDVTLSPDLPSVALAAAEVFADAGFGAVDGVLVVDPYALAALLEFTGPLQVDGLGEPLDVDNAADWLLRRQYVEFDGRDERVDLLDEVSRETFEALVSGTLPGPRLLSQVLDPLVDQRRLVFVSFDEASAALFERLGAHGAFPRRDSAGGDLFALVTQNAANNKIDAYLARAVTYVATVHPEVGTVQAEASIVLANEADLTTLPEAVVGSNDRDLPLGTNRMFVSFYSPLHLVEARIDGALRTFERDGEFGWSTYSTFVEIPAGGSITIDLILTGVIDVADGYTLTIPFQPLVDPDQVEVRILPEVGWEMATTEGWARGDDGALVVEGPLELPRVLEPRFRAKGVR